MRFAIYYRNLNTIIISLQSIERPRDFTRSGVIISPFNPLTIAKPTSSGEEKFLWVYDIRGEKGKRKKEKIWKY